MSVVKNPEFMVIGDSLAQGCRSLSVVGRLNEQCYGARISAAQDWKFSVPNHPRPVGFDLEELIRKLGLIAGPLTGILVVKKVKRLLRENILEWQKDFDRGKALSTHRAFDNVGIAGATIPDLLDRNYQSSLGEFEEILAEGDLDGGFGPLADVLMKAHVPINSCFTLNPSQKSTYRNYVPMRWVEERKPKRLVVQIGHNHGLFGVGFSARYKKITYSSLPRIEELAGRLASLPASVGQIYYFLLPKVSAVANLVPIGDLEDGYAEEYRSAFDPSASDTLSGEELREIDESIADTNATIQERFREIFEQVRADNSMRLNFVDAFGLFERYDFKNTGLKERQIRFGKQKADNRRIDGKVRWVGPRRKRRRRGTKLVAGGFQSADGMHPSGLGYAVVALELMKVMALPIKQKDQEKLLKTAFKEDPLLSRYPIQLDQLFGIFKIIQDLGDKKEVKAGEEVSGQELVAVCERALRTS